MSNKRNHGKEGRKELIRVIERDGWYQLPRTRGSHLQFKHPVKTGRVTVPYRITPNIRLSVLRQAGLRNNNRGA